MSYLSFISQEDFHHMNVLCYLRHFVKTSCGCYESCTLPLRCARFTPPSVKYLILDDFHFRIDPQIINIGVKRAQQYGIAFTQ